MKYRGLVTAVVLAAFGLGTGAVRASEFESLEAEVRKVFPEPADNLSEQVLPAISDVVLASLLWKFSTNPNQQLVNNLRRVAKEANFQAYAARRAAQSGISLEGGVENGAIVHPNGTAQALHGAPDLDDAANAVAREQAAQMAKATEYAKVREQALKELQKAQGGFFKKNLRRVMRIGAYVFIIDEAARVTVWFGYDANPKSMPLKDISMYVGQQVYNQLEESGFLEQLTEQVESTKETYQKRFNGVFGTHK